MLKLVIPKSQTFNEDTLEFDDIEETVLNLEHSLLSISKWESMYHKPFLTDEPKTAKETIDYIKCMTINKEVDDKAYKFLKNEDIAKVNEYISDTMTATWFGSDKNGKGSAQKEIITAEIIYYEMIALNIPFDCQRWHLNRLLTLIKVCSIKNQEQQGGSRNNSKPDMKANASLMAARRAKMRKPHI